MERMRTIFFFIVMLSSVAEDIKSNHTCVEGGSVTFPDPVLKKGFFSFGDSIIASVSGGKHEILEEIYKDRLFWDKETGLFTLRGLQRNDSGIFIIHSKDGKSVSTYHKLTVYVMLSSAAEDTKSNLTRVQGGSVTFLDPVLKEGFFSFEGNTIASVSGGKHEIQEKTNEDRLFWDKETGLFTLRGLQRNDSGIFKIESKDGKSVITHHKLTVYEPVSAPEVRKLNVITESCILLCEVQKAEETTLYWYRNEEIVDQSGLALSLPLTVEDFRSSYRCVAENPAENKTIDVNATAICYEKKGPEIEVDDHTRSYWIVVPIVVTAAVVVVTLLAVLCLKRKATQETQGRQHFTGYDMTGFTDSEVVYTYIDIPGNRRRVGKKPNGLS